MLGIEPRGRSTTRTVIKQLGVIDDGERLLQRLEVKRTKAAAVAGDHDHLPLLLDAMRELG